MTMPILLIPRLALAQIHIHFVEHETIMDSPSSRQPYTL